MIRQKLLYLVTEDWFFCSHFLPMARGAKAAGFDVSVATRVGEHGAAIEAEGFRLLPFASDRRSLSPLRTSQTFAQALELLRAEKPDIVHCIALPMVVLGGMAARFAGIPAIVLAPTGLGHLWIEDDLKVRMARHAIRLAVMGLQGSNVHFLFENADDPREFGIDAGDPSRVTIVGGAGVDGRVFRPAPEPPGPSMKVALVARMIDPKGIAEAVAAVNLARSRGADIELDLYGAPDPQNRRSIDEARLQEWSRLPGITWRGATGDIAGVWRDHHAAILLSSREGAPRSLIEAAASGRPIVATDVTGCREIVKNGENGFLVKLNDVGAAADALVRLAENPDLRAHFGENGRERFERGFTADVVAETVLNVYRRTANARLAAA